MRTNDSESGFRFSGWWPLAAGAVLFAMSWAVSEWLTPERRRPTNGTVVGSTSDDEEMRTGARIYGDVCARCHGEDGRGSQPIVPALPESEVAGAMSPAPLVAQVVRSSPLSMMPAFGSRLTDDELVAVVNHVRRRWAKDPRLLDLRHRQPPPEIEREIRRRHAALRRGDPAAGESTLAAGEKVLRISYPGARYHYDPTALRREGASVVGMGGIYLETRRADGEREIRRGRFVRIYRRQNGEWELPLDVADMPDSGARAGDR